MLVPRLSPQSIFTSSLDNASCPGICYVDEFPLGFCLFDKMEKGKTDGNNDSKEIIRIDLEDSGSDSNNENLNQQIGSNGNTENQDDNKISKLLKELIQGDDTKFMNNFYPELSNREKRKLSRKFALEEKKNTLYDEHGVLRNNGRDICDCLNENCVGCHFPCPKCRSCKCGQECRVNRKWMYESVENEGDKSVFKNNIQIQ